MWDLTERPPRPRSVVVKGVHYAALTAAFGFDLLRAGMAAVAELTGGGRSR